MWADLLRHAREGGVRNAQATLIPPTRTVSVMLDCETTGVEPYYALAGTKRLANGGEIRLSSRVLAHGLLALGYHPSHVEELCRYAAEHGHLAHSPRLRAADAVVFQTSRWSAGACPRPSTCRGRKAQVRGVASNAAHCLCCGIVDDDKAALVAERLMAPDIFSGWGIRTLSSGSPGYNPMSYHNGSVWPHDNAIAAAGLKRDGFHAATARVASALFDVAANARDFRPPELFCGFSRDGSNAVVAYPVACIPQAWAAAAPFLLLQALLGISAHAAYKTLTVERPSLPDWLAA